MLTLDNGTEFHDYAEVERQTGVKFPRVRLVRVVIAFFIGESFRGHPVSESEFIWRDP
jgi:hypothetical protein